MSASDLWNFRRGDSGGNDEEQRNGGSPGPEAEENQKPAKNFEDADKMSRKSGMRKADACKPQDSQIRVCEFENSLRKENQPDRQADQPGGAGAGRALEKIFED